MIRPVLLAAGLLLSGCATVDGGAPPATEGSGECRNDALAGFTGEPATAELGAEILRQSGSRVLQWIRQGDMVTMEYRADRVRVQLDAVNRVESARCG